MALPSRRSTGRALTASAVKLSARETAYSKRLSQPWQLRALAYYDTIGEINFTAKFLARQISRVKFYPAKLLPDKTTEPITTGPPVDLLNLVQDPGGGCSQYQFDYGRLQFITGEGVLFGYDGGSKWKFLWKDEVKRLETGEYVRLTFEQQETDEVGVGYRFWTPHPRWSDQPDAPMRAVQDICEELLILTLGVRATALTRLTNGIVKIPTQLSPNPLSAGMDEDPEQNPLLSDWIEHVSAQIDNPGSVEARIPFLIEGDYEYLDGVQWMKTHDPATDYMERDLRKEAIERLALSLDMSPEDLLGYTNANHWCQSDDTEVFARGRGFVDQSELAVGEDVLTLNHETGLSEWAPVEDIYRAPVVDELMWSMEGRSHSSLSTGEHRWPIVEHVPGGSEVSDGTQVLQLCGVRQWTTSQQGFSQTDKIPTAAPMAPGFIRDDPVYADDLVRLAVAYTADGTHLAHDNIRIVKFQDREIVEMRRILTSLFGEDGFREHRHPTSTATGVSFVLRQYEAAAVLGVCGEEKALTIRFVEELTEPQLQILLDSCAEIGDGIVDKHGGRVLYQADPSRLEPFAYAAHLRGHTVTTGRRKRQTGYGIRPLFWIRWTARKSSFRPSRCEQTVVPYTGTVWCPVTRNQTWFARRNGKAYFTGNTGRQVQLDRWRMFGFNKAEQFATSLADAYLRPALRDEGYPDWEDVVIGFDDSQVVISPDRTEDALKAYAQGIINGKAAREALGWRESDALDGEEKDEFFALKLRAPELLDGGDPVALPARGPLPSQNGRDPEDGPPSPGTNSGVSRRESMSASLVAGAASMALHRCRELAGARIQLKCKECGDGAEKALVASVVGPSVAKDPAALVRGGADGFRALLQEWGVDAGQAAALQGQLEAYASRTLFEPACPDLPPGFVSAVGLAREAVA